MGCYAVQNGRNLLKFRKHAMPLPSEATEHEGITFSTLLHVVTSR